MSGGAVRSWIACRAAADNNDLVIGRTFANLLFGRRRRVFGGRLTFSRRSHCTDGGDRSDRAALRHGVANLHEQGFNSALGR